MGVFVTTKALAALHLRGEAMPEIVEDFTAAVKGKKITRAGYLVEDGEAVPVLILDDGSVIFVSGDDESNSSGVLDYVSKDGTDVHKLCTTDPKDGA